MTDAEVIAMRNSLEMMRRPHLWPHTVLPLRKPVVTGTGFYDIAILVCTEWHPDPENPNRIYMVLRNHNVLLPIPDDAPWERGDDELLVKLVKEGWEVD